MPKFGQLKFAEGRFGDAPSDALPRRFMFATVHIGTRVRRHVARKVIYRRARGHQFKYDYFTPANPQTVPQQAWRTTFKDGVTQAMALTDGQKEPYRVAAKRKPGQTWFSLFMSQYLIDNA